MKSKPFKEFYQNYYNNKSYRDIRYIQELQLIGYSEEKEPIRKSFTKTFKVTTGTDLKSKLTNDKRFINFLMLNRTKGAGTLASEVTYYNNFLDWNTGDKSIKYIDRLFFDLDTDNKEAKAIKNMQTEAKANLMGKERARTIKELQKEFRELIVEKHILYNTFTEAKKLLDYLVKSGAKPYLTFSGSKGLHINTFIEPLQLNNSNKVNEAYTRQLKRELKLKTLDLNVKDISSRLQRVPYSKHERTGLYAVPLAPSITYEELIETISSNKLDVTDFNINDYYSSRSFRNMLIVLDNDLALLDSKNKATKEAEAERNRRKIFNNSFTRSDVNYNEYFTDLRDLVELILGTPVKRNKDYNMYKCCFHNDNTASAICGKFVFYCFSCGANYNWYNFIKNYYKLDSAKAVFSKAEELKQQLK